MAKAETMVIKFLRRYEVQDEHAGTEKATIYQEGLRKSFPVASAEHFINRKVAVPAGPARKGKA